MLWYLNYNQLGESIVIKQFGLLKVSIWKSLKQFG